MGYCIFLRKGETHSVPIAGTKASDLAIGSIVKLNENGVYTDFIVVNQGIPENSSLYDSSCDGTWLLRKDIYDNRQWNSSDNNVYEASAINTYLNEDYFNTLGSMEQKVIKQVKLPYRKNGGSGGTDQSGANGLSAKIFLLSGPEVGSAGASYMPNDGAKLDYFNANTGIDSKRIAYLNGSAAFWWLRSPGTNYTSRVWGVNTNGDCNRYNASNSYGIRPALIIPSNAKFDTDMKLIG